MDNLTAKENILLPCSVDANESIRLELLSQYLDISELLDKFYLNYQVANGKG